MHVGIQVDLYDTVGDRLAEVVDRAATATVENEEDRLVVLGLGLLLDKLLVLLEQFRAELDVTRLVDSVNVTKASSDGEVLGDFRERLVDIVDVLGLGVKTNDGCTKLASVSHTIRKGYY